jgi:hypothetical protein
MVIEAAAFARYVKSTFNDSSVCSELFNMSERAQSNHAEHDRSGDSNSAAAL